MHIPPPTTGATTPPTSPETTRVSESALPEMGVVECLQCERENPVGRKFCGGCGGILQQACVDCGAVCPVSEIFCGSCGSNLKEKLNQLVQRFETSLAQAAQHRQECRYEDASRLLKPLLQQNHPRLAALVQQAKQDLQHLEVDKQTRQAEFETAFKLGQQYAETHEYERARCVMEATAPALRTPEFRQLLANMQARSQELASLTFEVRKALLAKQTIGILPMVQRLLELRPGHAETIKLAQHLETLEQKHHTLRRDQLLQKAEKRLAENQYQPAVEYLDGIHLSARTPAVVKLHEEVQELAWLARMLRTAPLADTILLGMAERLVKLRPKDAEAARLLAQLRPRAAKSSSDPRRPASSWAKPCQSPRLGRNVEWLGGSRRLAWPEGKEIPTVWKDNPGRFFVAVGLALQGLGKSTLQTNLLFEEKTGILQRLTKRKKKPLGTAWGIDLGPSGLKAVKLVWQESSQSAVCEACELIEHPLENRLDSDRQAAWNEVVKEFLSRHDLRQDRICVGLPGHRVLARFVTMPPLGAEKILDAVPYEAKMQIPMPLETVSWDFQFMDGETDDSEEQGAVRRKLMILAAKRNHILEHLEPLQKHQLQVDIVQSESAALYNFLMYELFSAPLATGGDATPAPVAGPPVMLVDLGSDVMNVVVAGPQAIWFRSVGRAADEFTKALVREFNLTYSQAEKVKREPLLAKQLHKVDKALEPAFSDLCYEITRSLAAVTNDRGDLGIDPIYFCGGGFQTHGLFRFLRASEPQ